MPKPNRTVLSFTQSSHSGPHRFLQSTHQYAHYPVLTRQNPLVLCPDGFVRACVCACVRVCMSRDFQRNFP
jgi:hypothetical protein